MNERIKQAVDQLYVKIIELPKGCETSTSKLLGDDCLLRYSTKELFDIHNNLIKKCENDDIKLNFDKYKDTMIGLPFNIPFTKK